MQWHYYVAAVHSASGRARIGAQYAAASLEVLRSVAVGVSAWLLRSTGRTAAFLAAAADCGRLL